MCIFEKINHPYIILPNTAFIFIISIIHIVFGALITLNKFNIFDLFDSSPLFDFSIGKDCQDKSAVVFHRWGGKKKSEFYINDNLEPSYKIVPDDETDLKKINGNYFCYKHITYRDLLNNGQIIKKGGECPTEYNKKCGKIDTLEQELCIKNIESCPLYDVGLGLQTDLDNYNYNEDSKIYYSKENYNKDDKAIIGRLILSDGIPCYNSSEKLWRKFDSEEYSESNLNCHLDIFEKTNDDRFEIRGNISYKLLYEENLSSENQKLVLDDLNGNEFVSLYKREFLGIDKECDEKYTLNENAYEKFHYSEKMEQALLIIEGIILTACSLGYFLFRIFSQDEKRKSENFIFKINFIFFIAFTGFLTACFICHIVAFVRITKYDLTDYNCSDLITNEVIRKGMEKNRPNVIYIKISFYLDLFLFVINCLGVLIGIILEILGKCISSNSVEINENKKEKNDSEIPLNNYYPNPN